MTGYRSKKVAAQTKTIDEVNWLDHEPNGVTKPAQSPWVGLTDDFDDYFEEEPLGEVVGFISDSNYIVVLVNEGMQVDLNDQVFLEDKKQRPWVGLTLDEIALIHANYPNPQGFALALQAKLKEKNT